jgi:hypothetical protein
MKKGLIFSHQLKCDEIFFDTLCSDLIELKYIITPNITGIIDSSVVQRYSPAIHRHFDFRRAVFPREVLEKTSSFEKPIDSETLSRFEGHLFNIFAMCSRIDGTGFSFSFDQRWEHLKELIQKLRAVLEAYEIELVVMHHLPHFPSEYILYCLCQQMGVEILMRTEITGTRDFFYSSSVRKKYAPINEYLERHSSVPNSEEGQRNFNRMRASYDEAKPWYIEEQEKNEACRLNVLSKARLIAERGTRVIKKLSKNTGLTLKINKKNFKDL